MIFSRWNNASLRQPTQRPLLQPFSWSSTHRLTTATPLSQILPLHLSKIKNLASSSKAQSKHCVFTRSYGAALAAPGGASGCPRNRDSRTVQEEHRLYLRVRSAAGARAHTAHALAQYL